MTTQEVERNFLRCPDAIPNRVSIRDQALWGDSIGAIWPDGEPTPLTTEQAESLKDIRVLRDAGVFVPLWLEDEDLEFAAKGLKDVAPPEVIDGDSSSWAATCGPLMASSASDTVTLQLTDDEVMRTLRHGKLTKNVESRLLAEGLVERVNPYEGYIGMPGDGFLRAKSVHLVPWLLTKAAQSVCTRQPDHWTLTPSSPAAVGQIACPKRRSRKDLALALSLPALPAIRDDVPIEELISLRGKRQFQEARAEYLANLRQLEESLRNFQALACNDPSDTKLYEDFGAKMMDQVAAATRPLWKGNSLGGMVASGVGVAEVVVAGASAMASPGVLSAVAAGLGASKLTASLVTAIVAKQRTPKFLRMSRSILAKPPGL